MRKIDSFEDQKRGVVTYELDDGRRLCLDERAVQQCGIEAILRDAGLGELIPSGLLPVTWHGERVGTVPATFDPAIIKTRSVFYRPRPGDFVRTDNGWLATSTLGPGDLEAVVGFVWTNPPARPAMLDNSFYTKAMLDL